MKDKTNINIFEENGLYHGRMVGGSKSFYRTEHPNHEVYFNANIFVNGEKVWYGDIDITLDLETLQTIANSEGDLYILREHDGRFENEEPSEKEIKDKAVKIIKKL